MAVRAALTVTFHGPKVGLAVAPGLFHAGEVVVAEIGLAAEETAHRLVLSDILEPRTAQDRGGHEVHGGLGARRRRRAGPHGRRVPGRGGGVSRRRRLCGGRGARGLALDRRDAVAGGGQANVGARSTRPRSGPGRSRSALGSDGRGRPRSSSGDCCASSSMPVVLDADALHELEPGDWRPPVVLTPHAGELGRLLGEESSWVDAHRLEAARRAAERFGCTCLLKGADTLVCAPDEGSARLRRRRARRSRRPARATCSPACWRPSSPRASTRRLAAAAAATATAEAAQRSRSAPA